MFRSYLLASPERSNLSSTMSGASLASVTRITLDSPDYTGWIARPNELGVGLG